VIWKFFGDNLAVENISIENMNLKVAFSQLFPLRFVIALVLKIHHAFFIA